VNKTRRIWFAILALIPSNLLQLNTANALPNYVFPVVGCTVKFSQAHHDYAATDILAKKGCQFVSPVTGTIDEVSFTDKWNGKTNLGNDRGGLSISIIGNDGVRYYASHFSKIDTAVVIVGAKVNAGDKLALIGSSGSARGTAPHLHFGISWPTQNDIWWVRRGVVNPFKYLKSWQTGKDLSPADEVLKSKNKMGEIPPQPKK
jgi:hypothetical protein